jgi:hypothetical protein
MPYFGNNPSPLLLNTVAQNGKEMTLDADADTSITADTDDQIDIKIGGADDFQFTANTFTAQSGSTIAAQALTATTITASGIIKTDDATDATSTTDGSLQTDGGLSVVKDAVFGDDVKLLSDSAVLSFGADSEVTLTHAADTGLTLNTGWTVTGTTTLNDDVTFTGANYNVMWDKSANDLSFDDNAKLTFGASNDLSVYHDGSNTYIDESGTGALFIRSSRVSIHKYTGETMINATEDSAVSLYYDDSKKLETTTNGVVVGGVTAETQQSGMKTVQVGARGFLTPYDDGAVYLNSNIFYNASGQWEYATNGYGNVLSLNDGALYYYRVASGSDGDVNPTLTQSFLSDRDGAFFVYANHNGDVASIIQNSASTPYGIDSKFNSVAPDNTTNWFYNASDSSLTRFRVYSDGDVVNHDNSYGASSDERIKQDIVDANSQWDDIKAIKVRNFKKKDDVDQYGDKAWTQIGVIAQELETVSPKLIKEHPPTANDIKHSAEFGTLYTKDDEETQDAVLYTKDDKEVKNGSQKVGDIKTPSTKQIGDVKEIKANVKKVSYSVLYMKAVKALQEAMTRIETLEAKVKTLEEA